MEPSVFVDLARKIARTSPSMLFMMSTPYSATFTSTLVMLLPKAQLQAIAHLDSNLEGEQTVVVLNLHKKQTSAVHREVESFLAAMW